MLQFLPWTFARRLCLVNDDIKEVTFVWSTSTKFNEKIMFEYTLN